MTRTVKDWKPDRVADATIAPHRYRYETTLRAADEKPAKDLEYCADHKERKANLPYVAGEVVYIDHNGAAVKARIIHAFDWTRDNAGFIREQYNVQLETKAGLWAKVWMRAYPGTIQRGYQRAGLAPDVDRWSPLK